MADTVGMTLVLRADSKGVVAEMRNAQGAVVDTARIMRSQLQAATNDSTKALSQFKEGVSKSREVSMYFTQALGELGAGGKTAQIALSGLGSALMGGGVVGLGLAAAQAALRLLSDEWGANAEKAKQAETAAKNAAEEIAKALKDAQDKVGAMSGKRAVSGGASDRTSLANEEALALAAQQVKIDAAQRMYDAAETPAAVIDAKELLKTELQGLQEIRNEYLLKNQELTARLQAEAERTRKEGIKQEAVDLKAQGEARDKATAAYMARINAQLAAEQLAAEERGRLMLKEQELEENRVRRAAEAQTKAMQEMQKVIQPVTDAIQRSFEGLVSGTMNVGQALRGVLAAIVKAFLETAIKQVMANAAVAGSGAAASQASVPIVGPSLAAAAMAAMIGMVGGLASMISASGGADIGNYNPVAQLHAREMVLPAHIADPLREAIAGGGFGGGVTVNLMTPDLKTTRRWLLDNSGAVAEAIGRAVRDGRRS